MATHDLVLIASSNNEGSRMGRLARASFARIHEACI